MKTKHNILIGLGILIVSLLVIQSFVSKSNLPKVKAAANGPLLQSNNLTYLGAFRLPYVGNPADYGAIYGFDSSLTGLAYNPARNSLFINNHNYEQKTAEISIPVLSTNMASLNRATFIQNFADITEGHRSDILADGGTYTGAGGTLMAGLLVYKDKLIGTSYSDYDANNAARLSHFTSGLDLSTQGDFKGMYQVGPTAAMGFTAGYMTAIPSEWQTALGGTALTGQCCVGIIARTSVGPSAWVFNPDDLGVKNPVPTTPVLYYDESHQNLARYLGTSINLYYLNSTRVKGLVFPAGTSSVLFFGTQNLGLPCYGFGTADPNLSFTAPNGEILCYDPSNEAKGPHGYPYKFWIWAYDANDLVSVKNGTKNPWDIKPYSVWELNIPLDTLGNLINGVAYDPVAQRIYISHQAADSFLPGAAWYSAPIIHVFQVNNNTPALPKPIVSMEAAPATITAGSTAEISWAATDNTTSLSIDNGIGTVSQYGIRAVSPSVTTTYTITASNAQGSISRSVTVYVLGTSTPTPTPTSTPTPTPTPTSVSNPISNPGPPIGHFDGIKSDGLTLYGYDYDPDSPTQSNQVIIFVDGSPGVGTSLGTITANVARPDVGSTPHGFEFIIPNIYRDGKSHPYYIYGIDINDGSWSQLYDSPKSFTVAVSSSPTLRGDLNNDGIVNSLDWSIMNSKWFTADAIADLNSDGLVNAVDFSILNADWFKRR